jgi:lysophospholipase L1-like esterase
MMKANSHPFPRNGRDRVQPGAGQLKMDNLQLRISNFLPSPVPVCCLLFMFVGLRPLSAGEPPQPAPTGADVLFDMETIRHRPGEVTDKDKNKVPIGTVELVEGKLGKAAQFNFTGGLGAGFMTAPLNAIADWNQADGFSFFVKGDGSTNWGGLEMIDRNNYGLRYGFCFSIQSRDWTKVVVPWRDLIPELSGPLVDAAKGYAPAGFGNFWFGKWFYWRDYPAISFAIDQVVLEKKIAAEPLPASAPGLQRLRAKLAAKKPVTIVSMGDSLSDKRHWANRTLLWSESLVQQLKTKYGSEVTLVNPAMGGTTLSQNLILMPRWVREAPAPDLVTVWFGFNDWDSGVRGDRFKEYLQLAAERIRRLTHGSTDILLLTTCPAYARWDTMKEMEQAARDVAAETGVGLADTAAEFRKVGSAEQALKQEYWVWDKTHLGPKGHALAAETVLKAIESGATPVRNN